MEAPPLEPAQAPTPSPSGPPPLEGGPPPLEDAPAPPGLSARAKPAPVSAPPPLEPPVQPPPLPLAPRPNGAAAVPPAAPLASVDDMRAAIVEYLRKKPGNKDLLNRLGLYLRSRKLSPDGQLKRFIQLHCQGSVVVLDSSAGTDMAQLASTAAAESAAERVLDSERQRAAAAAEAARPASAGVDNFDPAWMEQRLMQHCVQLQRSGVQPTMPVLGTFCIEKLGLQMKGKLRPFLERRPQLCTLSDDGRQHVQLTAAGVIRGGGIPSMPVAPAAKVSAAERFPGASAAAAAAPTDQVAADVMPGVAAAQSAAKDYKKWDALTKEIFHFVRSKGVATYNQIDAHIKSSCAKMVAASGIPLDQWRSQFFLHKRRNIFRLQGPVVSLAAHIPEAVDDSKGAGSTLSAIPQQDEFPPLPGSSAAAGASSSSSGTPRAGAGPTTAAAGGEDAATGAGARASAALNLSANPLLAAFAAERQMLEQLRDDVQLKLSSFKALSELQKENSGLRAACVTLGRELLSLKAEFGAFQQQTVAAIAVVSPAAATLLMNAQTGSNLTSPMGAPSEGAAAAFAPAEHAASAEYAAEPPQQQEQQQQVQEQLVQQAPGGGQSVSGLSPASLEPTTNVLIAPLEAADVAGTTPMAEEPTALPSPPHIPAASAGQATSAANPASPMLMPAGQLVVVGGHDGVSWLDSVECFTPSDSVWASLPLLDQPRSFAAAVSTPSEIFIAGGGNGIDWFDSVLRYDRQAGPAGGWQELAPLQVARGSLAAGMARGYLFAFGGGKPKEQYNVVEWYDPQSNRWLPGPPLTCKRFALGGAALGGALYAVGGYDGTSYLDCAERLDPRTDCWHKLPGSMASKRGGHALAAADGLLYALGGFNSVQAIPSCEVFEPEMNRWRCIADMSDSRAYGSSAVLGSTVFAVGGLQSDMQTHAILLECYNPTDDSWRHVELPANANPRRSFLAACGLE
ncbi:hypothetical protein D9Q98_001330 [Chlorella vulgaris]|uniref:Uncharacterized protein n=1 Tax=Chlorella vulgaris TaxID=3077 RepID=A0A9D4U1K8_CHLVU|nr:hypothetical protein D9Q98_001330 [Chlorella vulgaris]